MLLRRVGAKMALRRGEIFMAAVVLGILLLLGRLAYLSSSASWKPVLVLWVLIVVVVELLPVPVSRVLQLSLSFPILLGVAILYPPPVVAASVALVGSFDSREIRGEISFLKAAFNRCQIAASVLVASIVFHEFASIKSPWYVILGTVVLATAASYGLNVTLVALAMRAIYATPLPDVLRQLRLGATGEFLLNYLGLGLVGVVMARLSENVGFWSVAAFILPLVFARQMFFRSMALEEAGKELKDRERVLRALSNRMAEERQDERIQIAGYLHDDLAQQLFRLTLQAEMAKKRLQKGDLEGAANDIEGVIETKREASDMVRALIRDLHRSPIGRRGLAEALQSFADDMSKGGLTRIETEVVEVSLPPPIQLLIYQIAREATMNALKHARAAAIRISLTETEDGVRLEIRDNGAGFDQTAAAPEGHFGTVMMRERALVAGGSFDIDSHPGVGTTVTAKFPRVWLEEGTLLEGEASGEDADQLSLAGPHPNESALTGASSQSAGGRKPISLADIVTVPLAPSPQGPPVDPGPGEETKAAIVDTPDRDSSPPPKPRVIPA